MTPPTIVAPDAAAHAQLHVQQSDGAARCLALAVFAEDGRPIRTAYQGQPIQVYCEIEVLEPLDAPIGWIELYDRDGRLVHGRTSAQFGVAHPAAVEPGSRLRLQFTLSLDLGPDEYTITVGLSSTDRETYASYRVGPRDHADWPNGTAPNREHWGDYREGLITEEKFQASLQEHLRATVGHSITVGFGESGQCAFNGLVRLPGACEIEAVSGAVSPEPSARKASAGQNGVADRDTTLPTIVHVTHPKSGSQWIAQILRDCAPDRIVEPRVGSGQALYWPPPGAILPTVYLSRPRFEPARLPPNSHILVVIRDLRDTLISGYFSVLNTHVETDRMLLDARQIISKMTTEDGLLYMLDIWLSECAKIQLSWLEADFPLIRYEDLVQNDLEMYRQLLIEQCGLDITPERLDRIVLANRFERYTNGRQRGVEDRGNHYRKGIAGDWVNHFTPRVMRAFKARYGGLLVETGYERDLDW